MALVVERQRLGTHFKCTRFCSEFRSVYRKPLLCTARLILRFLNLARTQTDYNDTQQLWVRVGLGQMCSSPGCPSPYEHFISMQPTSISVLCPLRACGSMGGDRAGQWLTIIPYEPLKNYVSNQCHSWQVVRGCWN